MPSVIAYTFEAAVHCPDCAFARFGSALNDPSTVDSEGNPIGVIFDTDEAPVDGLACDSCGEMIVEPVEVDGVDFLAGYMECALWSSHDMSEPEGDECLDEWATPDDFDDATQAEMEADCDRFIEANLTNLREAVRTGRSAEALGHDYWLSRNGHGAGFFDNGRESCWDALQDAARADGEVNLESYLDQRPGYATLRKVRSL